MTFCRERYAWVDVQQKIITAKPVFLPRNFTFQKYLLPTKNEFKDEATLVFFVFVNCSPINAPTPPVQ